MIYFFIILLLIIIIMEAIFVKILIRTAVKTINTREKERDKFSFQYKILVQWMDLRRENKSLSVFFERRNYKKIAIYGMAEMGCFVYEDLENSSVEVSYVMDRGQASKHVKTKMLSLDEELPEVDAIIVTPVSAFSSIKKELEQKIDCPILSLDEVVFSI